MELFFCIRFRDFSWNFVFFHLAKTKIDNILRFSSYKPFVAGRPWGPMDPGEIEIFIFLFHYFCLVFWFYDIALGLRSMEIFSKLKSSKKWQRYKRLKFSENRWKTAKIVISPQKSISIFVFHIYMKKLFFTCPRYIKYVKIRLWFLKLTKNLRFLPKFNTSRG